MASDCESSSDGSHSTKRRRSETDLPEVLEEESEENVVNTSRSKGVVTASLVIRKAHQMVEDCSRNFADIVSWNREGDKFEVKDKEALEEKILPQYFNHSAFSSFSKQMNVYGFLKWKTEPIKKTEVVTDSFMFQHESFRRGRLDLLKNIKRKPTSGSRSKRAKTSSGEAHIWEQRLQAMEATQSILKTTVHKLEQVNFATKAHVEMLQKQDAQKDEAIKAQEMRIKQLETKLFSVLQQQGDNNNNSSNGASNANDLSHSNRQNAMPSMSNQNTFARNNSRSGAQHQMTDSFSSIAPPLTLSGHNRIVSGPSRSNSTNSNNLSNGGAGPTLRPHPNKKSLSSFALPSPTPVGNGIGGATLRPHPNKKSLPLPWGLDSQTSLSFGGNRGNNNRDPLASAVFRETSGDSLGTLLARYDSLGGATGV